MKAMLVIDMPESCAFCRLMIRDGFSKIAFCTGTEEHRVIPEEYWTFRDEVLTDGTENHPDWCPLRPLPEKKWIDPHDVDMFDHGENYGWNACLDAITGGTHE